MASNADPTAERFRVLVETLPHGVQECDRDGVITFANRAHATMHGYAVGETIGMHVSDLLASDTERRELREYLAYLVREQPPPIPYVTRDRTRDGTTFDVKVDWSYRRDAEGRVVGFVAVVTDISERVEAERRLEAARDAREQRAAETLRVFMACSPNPMLLLERDGTIVATNRALAERFSSSVDALIGRGSYELLPPDVAKRRREVVDDVFRSGAPRYLEDERGARELESWVHPVFDVRGEVDLVAVYSVDVTDRKRHQRELAAKEAELQQARRMEALGRLAGGMAHDLNNMLQVISNYAQLAESDVETGSHPGESLAEIQAAVGRAKDVIGQLLTFGGKQVTHPRVVDLDEIVASLGSMLRSAVGERVDLDVRLAPSPVCVRVDPWQIEQVIVNLVLNARDAMPGGGVLTVAVEGSHRGGRDEAVLRVVDTGVGMDEATQKRIFEPFFTTKPPGQGTGLGLSTVFGIVTQCGGDVAVESEPGVGSSFEIRLPRVRAEAVETGATVPTPRTPEATGGAATVLLVEDEGLVRRATSLTLRRSGFEVLEADGAAEALRWCREAEVPPDVLVTDVVMPGVEGPELASSVREHLPGIGVIFVSGHSETLLREGALDGLFLSKPYQTEELVACIRRILGGGRPAARE
jgi:PAS domain S-box-containing protein